MQQISKEQLDEVRKGLVAVAIGLLFILIAYVVIAIGLTAAGYY